MIRFVDLGKQLAVDETSPEYPRQFAFYDMVSDEFINLGQNGHVWDSWMDILRFAGDTPRPILDHLWDLSPEWTKASIHPDAANRINAMVNATPEEVEKFAVQFAEVFYLSSPRTDGSSPAERFSEPMRIPLQHKEGQ